MADTDFPLKTQATAEIDGVKVSANHKPETYELIKKAQGELKDWHIQWGAKPERDHKAEEEAAMYHQMNTEAVSQG